MGFSPGFGPLRGSGFAAVTAPVVVLTAAIIADNPENGASVICNNHRMAANCFTDTAQITHRITGSEGHVLSLVQLRS
jgi:hypothetical protein